jgi:hypothetical protein
MYDHVDISQPWPTLRELIAANTRILFFIYNSQEQQCWSDNADHASCPSGFHEWFEYAGESQYQFDNTVQVLDDTTYACEVTRGAIGANKFYGVNVFIALPTPESCAVLNTQEALAVHLKACADLAGRPVNLLLIDCWDIGDTLAVVSAHNDAL